MPFVTVLSDSDHTMKAIAKSLHVSDAKVWGFAIVPLAATLTSLCNALSRIIWGSVSDRLGRERTMFLTFGVEAILVYLVTKIAGTPIAFLVPFSFIFLFWGEIYSLFSATTGDTSASKGNTSCTQNSNLRSSFVQKETERDKGRRAFGGSEIGSVRCRPTIKTNHGRGYSPRPCSVLTALGQALRAGGETSLGDSDPLATVRENLHSLNCQINSIV
jgi:hypothetical protein